MKEINPLIKPLIADLLKLGIGSYFISTTFHRNLIKINLHEYWDKIFQGIRGSISGQHLLESQNDYNKRLQEATFIQILNNHIEPNTRNALYNFTQNILIGWINHSKINTKNCSEVLEDLKVISFPTGHLNRIKTELAKNDNIEQVQVLEIEKIAGEKADGKVDKKDSKIFISHSSLDKNIIDKFVEKVLQLSLKIPDSDIFCSSIEGLGIRTGKDFRQEIKDKITKASLVIIFLSENYKKSEICLNEMGAAWVLSKDVIPILIPPVTFKEVGPLHVTNHLDKIEKDASLDNIINSIKEILKLSIEIDFPRWNKHKNDLLNSMKNIITPNSPERMTNIQKIQNKFKLNDSDVANIIWHIGSYKTEFRGQITLAKKTGLSFESIDKIVRAHPEIFYRSISKSDNVIYKLTDIAKLEFNQIQFE